MAKAKKPRKKGAGRPPAGPIVGKVSVFSTRITAETRAALKAERDASGQSISQIAEQAITLGLETKQERKQRSPVKALAYLVAHLADACSVATSAAAKPFEWSDDQFVFDALVRALALLFEQLRPSDSPLQKYLAQATVHPVQRELLATPETWAKHVFWNLWDELAGTQHLPPLEPSAEYPAYAAYAYSLHKVRRDLNLDESRLKPTGRDGLAEGSFGRQGDKS
jgi:hypothetical protein